MSIFDEIRKDRQQREEEERNKRLAVDHSTEEWIINVVVEELERKVRGGQYRHAESECSSNRINDHLALVSFRNGDSKFMLINNNEHYYWQEGRSSNISDPSIVHILHHPFDKFDINYIRENLTVRVKSAFGSGVTSIEANIMELYEVDRPLFSKFNRVINQERYTLMVDFMFRI